MKFLASYKGALHGGQPRHRAARRVDHARSCTSTRRASSSTRARTRSTATRAPRTSSGSRKLAARQEAEIKRLKTLADSMRGQTAKRARDGEDARHARRQARGERKVEGPAREKRVRFRFPEPPHCGRTVLDGRGPREVLRRAAGVHDVSFSSGAASGCSIMGLNGAGKTSLLRILTGADRRRRRRRSRSGTASSPATTRRSTRGSATASTCCTHMRDGLGGRRPDAAIAARACSGCTGEIAFQDAGTLSGGEKTKLALAQLVAGPQEPAAARRADEQPRPAVADGDRRGARRTGRARW